MNRSLFFAPAYFAPTYSGSAGTFAAIVATVGRALRWCPRPRGR